MADEGAGGLNEEQLTRVTRYFEEAVMLSRKYKIA